MPIDPLPLTESEPELTPQAPMGDVDGNNRPFYVPKFQHRPHAFVLSHGADGARVGYGRLYYRRDQLTFMTTESEVAWAYSVSGNSGADFDSGDIAISLASAGDDDYANQLQTCHQGVISGLTAHTPRVGSASGDVMDSEVPNVYHQLEDYGDVYLYFSLDISSDQISNVYVRVGLNDPDDAQDIPAVDTGAASHLLSDGDPTGVYRVKLGTVNEDESIEQLVDTDVFFSSLVFTRSLTTAVFNYKPPEFLIGFEDGGGEQQNNDDQFGYIVRKPPNATEGDGSTLGIIDPHYEIAWDETVAGNTTSKSLTHANLTSDALIDEEYTRSKSEGEVLTVSNVCWRAWPTDPFRKVSGTIMKITAATP